MPAVLEVQGGGAGQWQRLFGVVPLPVRSTEYLQPTQVPASSSQRRHNNAAAKAIAHVPKFAWVRRYGHKLQVPRLPSFPLAASGSNSYMYLRDQRQAEH